MLDHLILKPTCYKRKTHFTIDIITINHKRIFWNLTFVKLMYQIRFREKPLPKENQRQFSISVSKTLIRISLMMNWEKKFYWFVLWRISRNISIHLEIFSPYKQKKVRYNNNLFITSQLRKDINHTKIQTTT